MVGAGSTVHGSSANQHIYIYTHCISSDREFEVSKGPKQICAHLSPPLPPWSLERGKEIEGWRKENYWHGVWVCLWRLRVSTSRSIGRQARKDQSKTRGAAPAAVSEPEPEASRRPGRAMAGGRKRALEAEVESLRRQLKRVREQSRYWKSECTKAKDFCGFGTSSPGAPVILSTTLNPRKRKAYLHRIHFRNRKVAQFEKHDFQFSISPRRTACFCSAPRTLVDHRSAPMRRS
jgi:hypothetical protein